MTEYSAVKVFDWKKIWSVWDDGKETWYYSIVDVVAVLTDLPNAGSASNYWRVLKSRLLKEGCELVTNCNQLKLIARGRQTATERSGTVTNWHQLNWSADNGKQWLKEVENQPVTNCNQLKFSAEGGEIVGNTRREIETKTGRSVISSREC